MAPPIARPRDPGRVHRGRDAPELLRAAGRPLSEVVTGAGFDVHLGWVGARDT